jgi:hypothetical protein
MKTLFKSMAVLSAILCMSLANASSPQPAPGAMQSYPLEDAQTALLWGIDCVGMIPSGTNLTATGGSTVNIPNAIVSCMSRPGITGALEAEKRQGRATLVASGTDVTSLMGPATGYVGSAHLGTKRGAPMLLFFVPPITAQQ